MPDIVIVAGTPGAGKTTIVDAVAKGKYKSINIGDLMTEIAIRKKYCKTRDEVRYLSNEETVELRNHAIKHIAKMKGELIIDTHATVQQHWRFVPGIPISDLKLLRNVRGIIYIDVDIDTLIKRRKHDNWERTREDEDRSLIATQRTVNISVLAFTAAYLNIPLYIIDNKEGQFAESRKLFAAHLKDVFQ